MNVSFRWQGQVAAICIGIICVVVGSTRVANAQTLPSNPLRPVVSRPTDTTSQLQVQQTSATEPVRAQTHSEEEASNRAPSLRTARKVQARPAAYGSRMGRRPPMGFVPPHTVLTQSQTPMEAMPEPIPMGEPMEMSQQGDMVYGDLPAEGEVFGSDCCDGPVPDCGGCGQCGTCNGCLIPCPRLTLDNFEIFAGVQGFTAPLNRGETGSFGFHYGANWSVPVPCLLNEPIGMQVGYRGVSSNYSGTSFSEDSAQPVLHYGRAVPPRRLGAAGWLGNRRVIRRMVLRQTGVDSTAR